MVRRGLNLVLQLNLAASHKRNFARIVDEDFEQYKTSFHPVGAAGELTLAWARLDIDLARGEALIEEVQSDWITEAAWWEECERRDGDEPLWTTYIDKVLAPHIRPWDETALAAAVWFLHYELGVKRIFYYTFETDNRLKQLFGGTPSRSLYAELPRKFCFQRTHNGPLFLRDAGDRRLRRELRDPATQWFVLEL